MKGIRLFNEQFSWKPEIQNGQSLQSFDTVVLAGMGGSHLAGWLLQAYEKIPLEIHRSYGLPVTTPDTLVILSSYSGNTEEVLDAAGVAVERNAKTVVITKGGKLLEFAKAHNLPYIEIPETHLEPRMAIGYSMLAIATLLQNAILVKKIRDAGLSVQDTDFEKAGMQLAASLQGTIPVLYSSDVNEPMAYIWKIKFNETSKIFASHNVIPELCHNELSGFDVVDSTRELTSRVHPIFLHDSQDHPRIQKRMALIQEMLQEKGFVSSGIALPDRTLKSIFDMTLFADWTSSALAQFYGVPNPETPLIAEFKRRLQ